MAAPTYVHAIPSLLQTIPAFPVLGNLNLNRSIAADTAINPVNLTEAKVVVEKLKATLESPVNSGVTDNMVQAAELRARAIEGAHTAAMCAPGLMTGIAAILQSVGTIEDRLDTIENNVQVNNAMTLNHRIIARNSQNQPNCEPLRKTVLGNGINRANALTPRARGLAAPLHPVPIGAVPPNFLTNISSYTNKDIAALISFYNEDFGIVEDDDEATRHTKLIMFLSRY